VLGIVRTGAAQVGVLVAGSTLLFGLQWGDPLGVVMLVAAVALAATGWGLVLAALARTPGQVASVGTALMLTFGVMSGTFVQTTGLPAWFRAAGKLTPNAWGLDGFVSLAQGGGLASITGPLAALGVMALALFAAAGFFFGRNRSLAVRG
jgi:ABC-2 type transport system permease protein